MTSYPSATDPFLTADDRKQCLVFELTHDNWDMDEGNELSTGNLETDITRSAILIE